MESCLVCNYTNLFLYIKAHILNQKNASTDIKLFKDPQKKTWLGQALLKAFIEGKEPCRGWDFQHHLGV